MKSLEEKQRECRDSAIERRQLREVVEEEDDDNDDESKIICSKKKNKQLHDELTGLHLRKTEKIRDCVEKNLENAIEIGTDESVSLIDF